MIGYYLVFYTLERPVKALVLAIRITRNLDPNTLAKINFFKCSRLETGDLELGRIFRLPNSHLDCADEPILQSWVPLAEYESLIDAALKEVKRQSGNDLAALDFHRVELAMKAVLATEFFLFLSLSSLVAFKGKTYFGAAAALSVLSAAAAYYYLGGDQHLRSYLDNRGLSLGALGPDQRTLEAIDNSNSAASNYVDGKDSLEQPNIETFESQFSRSISTALFNRIVAILKRLDPSGT